MISNALLRESAQEHIARIRREKFSLDDSGQLVAPNPLAGDLHQSVTLLSEGLYQKDIHFVLELIQNAEDNRYPADCRPELMFRMLPEDPTGTPSAKGALLILNNESGFRPQDVEALCGAGISTKTSLEAKSRRYIGEKGIGFKSVFRVTRRPHLLSAGYQFRFDRDPDPQARLGYIIPYWIDDLPPEIAEHQDGTCILLPLDARQWTPMNVQRGENASASQWDLVAAQLEGIAPETILFLSRLEQLTIELPGRSPLRLSVDRAASPLVHLSDGDKSATYWVHHHEVTRPADLQEDKRLGTDSRVVSVAFPLAATREPDYSVFAYLPTEVRSGYRFLVNADFILSTSRETILVDRPWNEWLRDQIGRSFVEGFCALLSDPSRRRQAYGFIPLTDDAAGLFFLYPVWSIHQQLRSLPVIWTISGEDLVRPGVARIAPTAFYRLLDSDRPPPRQLQVTPLVRPEIQQYSKQLSAIGVTTLQPSEVRACLQDEVWLAHRPMEWFVRLYRYLFQESWRVASAYEREAKSLEGLTIIPTSSGRLATIGREVVYLPEAAAEALASAHAELLGGLDSIAFLNADLYRLLANQPELLDWIRRNFARPWTSEAYCRDLVRVLAKTATGLDVGSFVAATRLIRDLAAVITGTDTKDLCDGLPLRLEDGSTAFIRRWEENNLVTPANLDPNTGWQVVFPTPDDRGGLKIVSGCYLESCTSEEERLRWATFFKSLGITDTPIPTRSWIWWQLHSLPADMPWGLQRQIREWSLYSTRAFQLSDVRLPRWFETLAPNDRPDADTLRRCRALLRWLESALDRGLREPRRLLYYYYRPYYKEVRSESQLDLQIRPFVPSTLGLRRPGEVFLDRPEVREIFGDSVPYATEPISPSLAEWLGVRVSATVSDVRAYLTELAERPAQETSAALVQRIYTFLMDRWRSDGVNPRIANRQPFDVKAMIRIEHPSPQWVLRNDAIWSDRSDVFDDTFAYLEPDYPTRLKEFFVDQLGVKADADDQLYARTWLKFQQDDHPDTKRVEAALERIFPLLVRVAEGQPFPPWWRSFLDVAKVWTQDNRFVPPTETFIPDDGALKKTLSKAGAHFVWRPDKASFANYEVLYSALGVRSLVEMSVCTLSADVRVDETPPGEEAYLCTSAKRGICLHLWNSDRSRKEYIRLRDDGTLAVLLSARESRVDRLVLQYQLDGISAIDNNAVAYFDRSRRTLYLSAAAPAAKLDIETPAHLARVLSKGRPTEALLSFIASIVGKTEQHLQYLSEQKDWHLPLEEREWMERAIAGQLDPPPAAPGEEADVPPDEMPPDQPTVPPPNSEPTPAAVPPNEGEPKTEIEPPPDTVPPGGVKSPGGGAEQPPTREEPKRKRREDGDRGTTRPGTGAKSRAEGPGDRERQERRSSYVEPDQEDMRRGHGMDPDKQRAIEDAGIAAAEAYELAHTRRPIVLGENHPGWDINSFEQPSLPDANPDRRIEVKAKEGLWDDWGVALTPTEFESARRYGETYYLYVVEHALDEGRRRIHVFRNPVAKATEYRFRQNWREFADEIA